MRKKRSITLGDHFEEFVKQKVASGIYRSVSETIRAGLQLLEEEEQKNSELKNAINSGIDSGVAVSFGPTMHLRELKKLKSLNE